MKSSNAKSLAFDAGFFTYSGALAIYLAWYTLHAAGAVTITPDQESAIAQMRFLTVLTALTLVACAALAFVIQKNTRTLGTILFGRIISGSPVPGRGPRHSSHANHMPPPPPRSATHAARAVPLLRSFWGLHLFVTLALTLIVSLIMTDFSLRELTDPDGLAGAARLFNGLAHANLSLLPVAIVQVIETIFIAFLATAIAVPFAFVLSFFSAKNVMTGAAGFTLYAALRTALNVVRSVEPLIWALIFTVWVGVGPFAGMLALMVHTVASLAKQFSEIVEDASSGPIDGIRATGAGPVQVVWFGIVPQVLLPFISFTIYRWDSNVRMATVIGLVGGGGIGTLLIKYQGQAMWPEVGCIVLVIAASVWLMDVASAYIREALR